MTAMPPLADSAEPRHPANDPLRPEAPERPRDTQSRGSARAVLWPLGAFLLVSLAQWAPWLLAAVAEGRGAARFAAAGLGAGLFASVVAWFRSTVLVPRQRGLGLVVDRSCRVRVLTGLTVGALAYAGVFLARVAIGAVTVDGVRDGRGAMVVLLAGLVLAGYEAVSEEIVFRGAFFGVLPRSVRPTTATALSVAVFVLYHLPKWESLLDSPYAIHLVLAGTAFAVAYQRTGSLWLGIGLHWGWNLGAYLLLEAGQTLLHLTGPPASGWGEWGSWLAVGGNLALLLVALAWPRPRRQ